MKTNKINKQLKTQNKMNTKNVKPPTVFDNNETGKLMQRIWIKENQMALTKNYNDVKSDLILVTPHDKSKTNAEVKFLNLDDDMFNVLPYGNCKEIAKEVFNTIESFVKEKKGIGKVPIIFLNINGRISCYNMKASTILNK